ncbi:hypothetical protein GCM10007923_31310 [Shinella yambaruensis]|uniref:Uncharacterized protein n=1 Tax=Shinella yambaruensis TaxID=415996 RepID=A0ABQ5ZJZ0_9HYPH|nr:hypothetical protein GCM10007923_31310 [Shinella yambaruensis]
MFSPREDVRHCTQGKSNTEGPAGEEASPADLESVGYTVPKTRRKIVSTCLVW